MQVHLVTPTGEISSNIKLPDSPSADLKGVVSEIVDKVTKSQVAKTKGGPPALLLEVPEDVPAIQAYGLGVALSVYRVGVYYRPNHEIWAWGA